MAGNKAVAVASEPPIHRRLVATLLAAAFGRNGADRFS
jgi:hypothetical protein